MRRFLILVALLVFGVSLVLTGVVHEPKVEAQAASSVTVLPSPTVASTLISPTVTPLPTDVPVPTEVPWVDPRDPNAWRTWDVLPTVYPPMVEIYHKGLQQGRNPHAFSKLGDCQNVVNFFLAEFDRDWGVQHMGEYSYLLDTIDWYRGGFSRYSLAVEGGMNVAGVQSSYPWQGTPAECFSGESRANCELRVNNPSIALISYEELWDSDTGKYEKYLESLVQLVLGENIVPILATTASNEDANLIVARLAVKYNLPVWNFWAALQGIPNNGLEDDGFHLTIGGLYNFEDSMPTGWPRRNLTALMSLDTVRKQLNGE